MWLSKKQLSKIINGFSCALRKNHTGEFDLGFADFQPELSEFLAARDNLFDECQKLSDAVRSHDRMLQQLSQEIAHKDYGLEWYKSRLNVVQKVSGEFLWEIRSIVLPLQKSQEILWSDQIKLLLGFKEKDGFPDVLQSLIDRLHPDDVTPTLLALNTCFNDRYSQSPFDITYRLLTNCGGYRFFRMKGIGNQNLPGSTFDFCGSIKEI